MSELIRNPDSGLIPLDNVLHLQSIAMGVLRERARRVESKPKMTGFVLFDRSPGDMDSNAIDTYMGVVARKVTHDYWQFSVSFLSYMMNQKLRYSNHRELYRFNWNADQACTGTKIIHDVYNPVVSTRHDPDKGLIDTVAPSVTKDWYPLDERDCSELRDRMLATASNVVCRELTNNGPHREIQ